MLARIEFEMSTNWIRDNPELAGKEFAKFFTQYGDYALWFITTKARRGFITLIASGVEPVADYIEENVHD